MNLDYKYNGGTVRERLDNTVGTHAGPVEWAFRLAFIGFMLVTMANPAAHVFIHPLIWVGIIALIFWS